MGWMDNDRSVRRVLEGTSREKGTGAAQRSGSRTGVRTSEHHSSPSVIMCWNRGAGEVELLFPEPAGSRGGSGDLLEDGEFELGLEECV